MSKEEKDLVADVTELIREVSPAHAEDFHQSFEGKEGTIEELNKHFRVELSTLPVDTIDARECLVNDISEDRWLGYFSDHVVRPITKYKSV